MSGSAPRQAPPGMGLGNLGASEAVGELAQQMGGNQGQQAQPSQQQMQALQQQVGGGANNQPREVGTLGEELVKRPFGDIVKGIRSIFSVEELLGVKSDQPDPEKQAKKKQLHQRFNQLSQEEQAVARERFQKEMERKQRMAQEDEMRRQQEAQQSVVQMPSSPQRGAAGPSGSKKQQAMQQLQDDRTKIGKVQGAN